MKKIRNLIILLIILSGFTATNKKDETSFKFAFLTDIHLSLDNSSGFNGFKKAIEDARTNQAEFIITGGDNMDIDVLGNNRDEAVSLFKRYKKELKNVGIKIYPTIGNHDRFMGNDKTSNMNNDGMYNKHISKSYYAFDYKNWHFIVLNTVQSCNCNGKYCVDKKQRDWLKNHLKQIPKNTPIVVSAHVPFLSVYYPVIEGKYTSTDTFINFKEIWDLFHEHNLKLVLQGHMHIYEEIKVKNVQFITAGAVSGSWWGGLLWH
jgi:UDP-2,3-diacylglucosamine pyrophosphatase LpxH